MSSQTSLLPQQLLMQQQSEPLQTIAELISVEDLHQRKYKLEDLTTELQLLKNKISTLRYEMISLMRLLATVNEDSVMKTPREFFNEIQTKAINLKDDIDSYVERYKKIQPLVAFAKKEQGKDGSAPLNVSRTELKIDAPIFANNQALLSNASMGQSQLIDATSARGGRGGAKRGPTARKPRGRGGSILSQRQGSRGGGNPKSAGAQTPQSIEYLGATASEPILL